MKTVQAFQIRKMYAIGNELGITQSGNREDELHAMIAGVTGKDSVKELTYAEAAAVIARLEALQEKPAPVRPQRKEKEHKSRPGGVTSGQQKKIWALMYSLKACDECRNEVQLGERLCGIIKKELHMNATAKEPFAWMTFEQGNNLIEKLKGYVANARKKVGC